MLNVITAAASSELTTLEIVKQDLEIEDDTQDEYLSRLIKEASRVITSECQRTTFGLEEVRQTERLAKDVDSIILDRDLEPEILSVSLNSVALEADGYELDGPLLRRLISDSPVDWAKGSKVEIVYRSGFALPNGVPEDLRRCCLDLIKIFYTSKGQDPNLRSEKVLDMVEQSWFSPRNNESALPKEIEGRLSRYRVWVLA